MSGSNNPFCVRGSDDVSSRIVDRLRGLRMKTKPSPFYRVSSTSVIRCDVTLSTPAVQIRNFYQWHSHNARLVEIESFEDRNRNLRLVV